MDGAGFGAVVVAGIHEAACTVAGSFKNVELFHLGMSMGTVRGAWFHATEHRRPGIDRILVEHFYERARTDFLPLELGCPKKGKGGLHLRPRLYLLDDLRQYPFPQ